MTSKNKKIINFCSVRGGPGKTTIMLAYGFYLRQQGKKVLLIDFDILGPVLDILFKKESPEFTITEYLTSSGDKIILQMKRLSKYLVRPDQLPYEYEQGLDVIFASREIRKMRNCYLQIHETKFFDKFDQLIRSELAPNYDYILIDNSPGIQDTSLISNIPSDIVLYFIRDRKAEIEDLDTYFPNITRVFAEKRIICRIIVTQSFESNKYKSEKWFDLKNIDIQKDILLKIPFFEDLRKIKNGDEVLFLSSNPHHPIYQTISEIDKRITKATHR